MQPLAERMRPTKLQDLIGQEHLTGNGKVLNTAMVTKHIPSMIFWGPPGVGKTSLAKIIAQDLERPFHILSAVQSGVKEVREVLEKAKNQRFFDQASPILFIDEIHRFNKTQQDALLAAVEHGTVSYTHLRAHETVLDLVCRLLLEKKTTINSTYLCDTM